MTLKYLKNVVSLSLTSEKCTGCRKCMEVCPHNVFDFDDQKARIAEKDLCIECGACALNCPAEALKVEAGTGCAAAIIMSWFTGKEPTCGCSGDSGSTCC